jgi:hypothetical protein
LVLAGVCLSARHGIATSGTAVLVGRCFVRIWRATTVLGIVLPTVTAPGAVSGAIAGIADILSI